MSMIGLWKFKLHTAIEIAVEMRVDSEEFPVASRVANVARNTFVGLVAKGRAPHLQPE